MTTIRLEGEKKVALCLLFLLFERERALEREGDVLDLSSTGFSRVLPESIGDLHSLEILWPYDCNFNGSIPSSLGNLRRLTRLELSFNELSGHVPPILSNLDRLTLLDLASNNFVGSIPDVFDNKTQLQQLLFLLNHFVGPIPPSIKNLSNLARLDISNNPIGGSIASSLFSLPSLTSLDLSKNGLSGHIGKFFAAPSLVHVDLSGNQLSGSIPSSIFQLGNLTYLSISGNNLTSVLDLQLPSGLRSLADLDLSNNILSLSNSKIVDFVLPQLSKVSLLGCNITAIPAFLSNSTSVGWIALSRNIIHGNIPAWMWDVGTRSLSYLNVSHNFLTSFEQGLQILDLSGNNFTGTMPQCLGNISDSLLVLDLQENGLSGIISLTFGKNAILRSLHLNGNKFEDLLPRSVINCTQLEALVLSGNKLNDTFPRWLETLPNQRVLVLRSNRLHGSTGNLRTEFPFLQLRILDLSSNKLTGLEVHLPKILVTQTTVDLSSNKFLGRIPDVIGELGLLKGLNLSHNNLEGHIPSSLGNLSELEWLDLSSNDLSEAIPIELTKITFLEVLNVSCNQLIGSIPQGKQFNTFQAESYVGNPRLCGFPLSKSCTDSRVPGKLPVLPEEAVEIGLLCGIVVGLVMSNSRYLRSFWRAKREVRKIARKHISPMGPSNDTTY
ncbi:hypothetical protein EUGRSUZ_F02782 [Eucalyptus grandis]|uniref:Uncharacterized protein n=1 Tax=Eucalyptus grandis TaxID=71139 RepID=A0ACC3KIW9_EUCGR|nr:hypothetical protein EUGRSUZ_F02782 [Eucalyptus grandis]